MPRAALNRPSGRLELLEEPIGELGVTCTFHIGCAVMLDVVLSSPCMYMHGFALVYIYIYMYVHNITYIPYTYTQHSLHTQKNSLNFYFTRDLPLGKGSTIRQGTYY